jgi:hypothetical protein
MEPSSIHYIIAFGFLMAAIAFSGSLTLRIVPHDPQRY